MMTRFSWHLEFLLVLSGCQKAFDPADGLTPAGQVSESRDASIVTVDKPEQFSVIAADNFSAAARLDVTGSVTPDVAR
jgi:hypothetical protein